VRWALTAQEFLLAAALPDAFRPGLAGSLNKLSNGLAELGRQEEALAAIQEMVEIRRQLADLLSRVRAPSYLRSTCIFVRKTDL
jgi:hypothetical protein